MDYIQQQISIHQLPTKINHAATVDLPDGSTHYVTGIGTIRLPIGDEFIELKNMRYIPRLKAQLLSFNQLEQQGFDFQLTNEKPYKFRITSPEGTRFIASRSGKNGVFDFIHPDSSQQGTVNAVTGPAGEQQEATHTNRAPPASIDVWHHRLSHMNQHDLQYLHRIGRINIQGKKLLTPCDYCSEAQKTQQQGTGPIPRATYPSMRLHVDIFGEGKTLGRESDDEVPPANGKYKYAMIMTDDATRMRCIFPL